MIASKIKKPFLSIASIIAQYRILSAFLLGGFLALAFAPFYVWPVVFIVYGLLYHICSRTPSRKNAALVGLSFYFGIIVSQFHWGYELANSFWGQTFSENWQTGLMAILSMFVFFCGTLFIYGFGFAVIHWFLQSPNRQSHGLYFAGCLVMMEHLQGFPFHGKFNWMQTGYAFVEQPYLAQLASLNTVTVISFFAIMISVMIAQIKNRYYLPPIMILVTFWVGYGAYHLHIADHLTHNKEIKIRTVSGNFDPKLWHSERGKRETFLTLLDLSQDNAQIEDEIEQTDLIIWPESGVPYLYNEEPAIQERLADKLPAPLISGSFIRKDDKVYNIALYLDKEGTLIHYVSKKFLVPFGEYWPFGDLFSDLKRKIEHFRPFFHRDDLPPIVHIADIGNILVFNCYDILFQSEFKDYARESDFMLHMTSEAWFSHSIQARQQILAFTRMRAIENRQYLIRVSDGGVNATIDPLGNMIDDIYDTMPVQKNIAFSYFKN